MDQTQAAAGSSQVEQTPAPQAGTTQDANPQAGEGTNGEKTYSETAYKKVQSEAINLRQRLKKYEESEEAALPELERVKKTLEKVEAERDALRLEARQARVMGAASKANALYPDAVARLVPDDATDFDQAIKEIRKSYPALFRQSTADGGAGNGSEQGQPTNMNQLIRNKIAGRA